MRVLRRRKLFAFAAFFGGGMVAARLLNPHVSAPLIGAPLFCAIALILHVLRRRGRAIALAAMLAFFLSASCAGAGYYQARMDARPVYEGAYDVNFTGRVAGSPYIDSDGARFVCDLKDVAIGGIPVEYRLRLYLRGKGENLDAIRCGQVVSGVGHLYSPEAVTNPHEFDFGEYLWQMGLAGYVTAKDGDVAVSGEGGGISDVLYGMRKAITERIGRAFPKKRRSRDRAGAGRHAGHGRHCARGLRAIGRGASAGGIRHAHHAHRHGADAFSEPLIRHARRFLYLAGRDPRLLRAGGLQAFRRARGHHVRGFVRGADVRAHF